MTFKELIEFIDNKMSMSHVYQPLAIRALVDADGTATLRQIAVALASQDEAVLSEAEAP
jgi:ATP adenylyltransferase